MNIITFKMHISFQMYHESREAADDLIDNKADVFTKLLIIIYQHRAQGH